MINKRVYTVTQKYTSHQYRSWYYKAKSL